MKEGLLGYLLSRSEAYYSVLFSARARPIIFSYHHTAPPTCRLPIGLLSHMHGPPVLVIPVSSHSS